MLNSLSKNSIKVFLASSFFALVTFAKTDLPAYTLIDSTDYKVDQLKCEIAVATNGSDVRVMRLDPRKGMYSVNYFSKSPALFGNFGIRLDLDDEFQLHGVRPSTVQASFNFKNSRHDLNLKIIISDVARGTDEVKEKTISLDQEFFSDHPKKCLK